ncbi:spore cortex biosynthesis protein YabQ [Weizmannia acidilactici]|uniref:Spore cortex biosynthesis protein YabQ n=1 Tax=Weizmannia acidilactici TaxID=2607726 RepID=A0A5J4JGM6_9BACI|nr:spore cortex biosynthesis protein YabQ [Weizmannia acidilactici]GER67634.1 spore cortex biosynthesis protein YabQ [Weizmannia acidilactici]GER71233.1 spore cortex biosynthesis protein YabQ [Weizmannia acidilactici]GER74662.1 spore cortex biosynthesis protein YabQ [Weizmannia acidilactici]
MSLTTQFYTMLAMLAMGSFFGGALDTYNRFLQRGKRKRWIVFIHDVLFWLCQSLLLFYVLFLVNSGEVRFYIFLALLCGFAAYQALFKRVYMHILEWCIQTAVRTAWFAAGMFRLLLFRPAKWFVLFLFALLVGAGRAFYAIVKMMAKMVIWILKAAFKPFSAIAGLLWQVNPLKRYFESFFGLTAGLWKTIKNKLVKMKNRIGRFLKK